MQPFILRFEKSELHIIPEIGCNPIELILNGQSVLDGNTDPEKLQSDFMSKGDFLAPFPNRVCEGKYLFQGTEYQLEQNESARGHALHGFLMKKQFEKIKEETIAEYAQVSFATSINHDEFPGYPFDVTVVIQLTLKNDELHIEMSGKNTGSSDAPFGIGWHPYLTVGKSINDCGLLIPAESILETDEVKELIPTGKHLPNTFGTIMKPISAETFDTCFVDLKSQSVRLENLELFFDENIRYIQMYTPDERNSIAIEPMSCAPDAFNNGLGLITLVPGEEVKRQFGIRLVVPFGSTV